MFWADDSTISDKGEVDLKAIVSQLNDWLKDARKMCGDAQQTAINAMIYEESCMPDGDDLCGMDDYTPVSSYSTLVDINERLGKLTHQLWKIGIRLDLIHDLL